MTTFDAGERAAIYSTTWRGTPTVRWVTVERVTKTQYVLDNGDRYRKEDRHEVGQSRYGSPELIAASDHRVAAAVKIHERLALVSAAWTAWESWLKDRASTPTDLAAAVQAVIDYDREDQP